MRFAGTLPGGLAAHARLDHATGELHAIAYYWAWDHVQHVIVGADGTVSRTTDIPVADGPMMHDFALTGSYVVLFDLPVTFSLDAVSAGLKLPYAWNPAHQPRVGLLPRGNPSAAVRWFEVDPCWVFHTLNAYDDDGGRVVVDLVRYEGAYDVSTLTGHGPLTLDRWVIDPAAWKVTQQRLDDRPQEFPRTDERVTGQPHRYGYSAVIGAVGHATVSPGGDFADEAFSNALLKHDLAAGTVQVHEFGRDATAGEAVFVPASPGAAEDDGYVMAYVHNPDRGAADLVLLAAQDFAAEPIARVHLPARIPSAFTAAGSPTSRSYPYARLYQHKHGPYLWRKGTRAMSTTTPKGRRLTITEDRTATQTDVVTKLSGQSVAGTVAKLTGVITAKGMKLFAVIDQAAEARQAGLTLRETTLVIFGSPQAGTPVMAASPLAALDLPLKVLIWADEGQTKVSYHAPAALAASHHLTADLAANLAGINALTDALAAS